MTDQPEPSVPSRKLGHSLRLLRSAARLVAPAVVLLLFAGFFSWRTNGAYLQPNSLADIGQQAALIVIVGIGATFVIIAGGIDLSVGAVVAFTGTLAAVSMLQWGRSPLEAAVLGTLAGGVIGFLNGLISVKAKVHPFIITLGAMMIIRGAAQSLTEARNTSLLPEEYTALASAQVAIPLGGGTELYLGPILVFYILIIGTAAHYLLTRTRAGRYCYAIGSNRESARLSGINVGRWTTFYFVLAGLLFGFAGVIHAARIRIGQPTAAEGMELEAIAAAVIGGTSLAGGSGTIIGTVLGALLMASLRQGLRMLNQPPYYQMLSLGAAIILAVIYDRTSRRKQ